MTLESNQTAWLPDLIYTGDGRFAHDVALVCDEAGRITELTHLDHINCQIVRLKNRALLPGLVNAHSHAFQRVIRGRTEYRTHEKDSFWTWREQMYDAAGRLTPPDIYDASRMAFLEMVSSGITAVGEFHYLHHAPDGKSYDDPNEMAKWVVRAARDTGLRIALLRVAYARSGFQVAPNENQKRFIEPDAELYLTRVEDLRRASVEDEKSWVGVAPHSVRAVPLDFLKEVAAYAQAHALPLHMHVAEQPAEVAACFAEYKRTPVELLTDEKILHERFTAVHGVHITSAEVQMLARNSSFVCACPTTERNLGDGVVPADLLFREGVRIALGTDSQTQINLLEDARELEYHLRLQKLERNVLAKSVDDETSDASLSTLAAKLFACATQHGAASIRARESGTLARNMRADFFTVDLDDLSIAGASTDALLANIVFSLARTAVREVCVGGKLIVKDGHHQLEHEIVEKFAHLQKRLWS
jgi:formimidoylglutamate deiminase